MAEEILGLTFDIKKDGWNTSVGFIKRGIAMPVLDEQKNPKDAFCVVLKITYAGVCGTDRGIFKREVFKNLIESSLENEQKTTRILGHEFLGEVVLLGSKANEQRSQKISIGTAVSGDSHITCGQCYQCKIGQNNVCTNELILGISIDGIFAQYVKLPAKNLFAVDLNLIRPQIASIMDPFGNAMHAVSKFQPKDQTVAVFGTGAIGLFAIAILKHFGAKKIIAIDVNLENLKLAEKMGADHSLLADESIAKNILSLTENIGIDVCMEMAGPLSSVLNSFAATRRGGQVVLFGLKDGDFTIPKFSQIITKGLTIYGVIGRRIFETWEASHNLLCDKSNGVQEKIWEVILKKGEGTIIDFNSYNKEDFEKSMKEYPKIIFKL